MRILPLTILSLIIQNSQPLQADTIYEVQAEFVKQCLALARCMQVSGAVAIPVGENIETNCTLYRGDYRVVFTDDFSDEIFSLTSALEVCKITNKYKNDPIYEEGEDE